MNAFITPAAGLGLALAAFYWWPLPRKSFDQLYAAVDRQQCSALQSFRLENELRTTRVAGSEWRYLAAGKGDRTLLFLHGMGGGYDIWWQQIDYFKTRFRIISMTYPPVTTLAALSRGVIALMDRERAGRVNIVGSSLGGYLAQYMLKNHPDRIEKAVLANTFPPNRIHAEKYGRMRTLLTLLPAWMVMRHLRQTTEKAIYPAAGHSELVRAYMLEQSYGMMTKQQFMARFKCVLDYFEPPNLDDLDIPCMIIEAGNDPLVEESLREMLKAVYPSTPIEALGRKGHFPYLNAPLEYNRILDHFFSCG